MNGHLMTVLIADHQLRLELHAGRLPLLVHLALRLGRVRHELVLNHITLSGLKLRVLDLHLLRLLLKAHRVDLLRHRRGPGGQRRRRVRTVDGFLQLLLLLLCLGRAARMPCLDDHMHGPVDLIALLHARARHRPSSAKPIQGGDCGEMREIVGRCGEIAHTCISLSTFSTPRIDRFARLHTSSFASLRTRAAKASMSACSSRTSRTSSRILATCSRIRPISSTRSCASSSAAST